MKHRGEIHVSCICLSSLRSQSLHEQSCITRDRGLYHLKRELLPPDMEQRGKGKHYRMRWQINNWKRHEAKGSEMRDSDRHIRLPKISCLFVVSERESCLLFPVMMEVDYLSFFSFLSYVLSSASFHLCLVIIYL